MPEVEPIVCRGRMGVGCVLGALPRERYMKEIAFSGWLVALICGLAGGCMAQEPASTEAPAAQAGGTQALNLPVSSTMTCGEFKALLKEDRWTSGIAIIWLDGYYSGRASLTEFPAGWLRTVSQGIGGTCAISANELRTVLDVIGQVHRDYAGQK